jgi:bidirectional [NiFe] hydrogenase diaphorase subunit
LKLLDATIKRHQYQQDTVIEILHRASGLFGYLELDLLLYIAHQLKLPPSWVYGVATFYHLFSLAPKGKHNCVVCTGTACYVKGSQAILSSLENVTKISAGETTSDGEISLMTARFLGACGIARAVVFDGAILGNQTPESVCEKVGEWQENGTK